MEIPNNTNAYAGGKPMQGTSLFGAIINSSCFGGKNAQVWLYIAQIPASDGYVI